ncbi:Arginine/serine-rich splicing factor scl25a transcript I [Dionaea muscipula]
MDFLPFPFVEVVGLVARSEIWAESNILMEPQTHDPIGLEPTPDPPHPVLNPAEVGKGENLDLYIALAHLNRRPFLLSTKPILRPRISISPEMRGRSYSPSPPRGGYGRRGRSPSPRGRYSGRSRDAPTSLLVRNLRHDCRPEDLRRPFGQFGQLKDIYLPRDYYSGVQVLKNFKIKVAVARQPRGFGFVQYVDPPDAAEAKYQMNGQLFQGRELTVVFAEENRKKPNEMRLRERGSRRHYDRRRSPARYSRSPPRRYSRSRSRSHDYYSPSPQKKQYSRSASPQDRKHSRERSETPRSRGRSYSRSPSYKHSKSRSRSLSRSRSASPDNHAKETRSPSRSW